MAKVRAVSRAGSSRKPASGPRTKGAGAGPGAGEPEGASRLIDDRIRELGGWRGETLARMRALIRKADPEMVEEWKWATPVWSHGGIVCTGEAYQKVVKLTFARGANVPDPSGLFNSSLGGNTRRAIDVREGEVVDAAAFQALVKAAVARNGAGGKGTAGARAKAAPKAKLLAGGNPQIAKGDGEAPVKAYLAAVPGWKRALCERLDALVTRSVPGVRKAVRWNSPFYGVEGKGWFLSMHCFERFVRLGFFRGASLRPLPPGPSKQKEVRYLDVHEGEALDEVQVGEWVRQAAEMRGWMG